MREDRQTPARKGPPSWTPSRRSSSNLCAVRNYATSTPPSRPSERRSADTPNHCPSTGGPRSGATKRERSRTSSRTAPSASAGTAASRTRAAHHHPRHVRHHGTPPAGRPPRTRRRADRTLRRHVRRPRSALQAPRRQNVHDTRPPHRLTHGQGVPARANQAIGDGLRRPGRATHPSRTSPRRPEPPAPDRHRSSARMRETRWTGKPYRKKERPKGARPQVFLFGLFG